MQARLKFLFPKEEEDQEAKVAHVGARETMRKKTMRKIGATAKDHIDLRSDVIIAINLIITPVNLERRRLT